MICLAQKACTCSAFGCTSCLRVRGWLLTPGRYLEIFARKNNLRNFWVSIGNEVTGTGLPEEDVAAFKQNNFIPGAVYGRGGTGGTAAAAGSSGAAGPG